MVNTAISTLISLNRPVTTNHFPTMTNRLHTHTPAVKQTHTRINNTYTHPYTQCLIVVFHSPFTAVAFLYQLNGLCGYVKR